MLAQLLVNGIIMGCLYALIGLGFGLIYNTTRLFHFAHGALYTVAAYLFYLFSISVALPLWLAVILALLLTSFLAVILEKGIYYPFAKAGCSLLILMIASLALYIILVNFIALFFGNETKVLSPGVQKTYHFASVIVTQIQLLEVFVFLLLFVAFFFLLKKTSLGRTIRALRDNPDLVTALGIDVQRVRWQVFVLGTLLTSAAALLSAYDVGIDPYSGLSALLAGAVAVIVGGIGIFESASLGGIILGLLQSLVIWQTSAKWQEAIVFIVLIFFLLFRPQGLLGKRKRLEEAS